MLLQSNVGEKISSSIYKYHWNPKIIGKTELGQKKYLKNQ